MPNYILSLALGGALTNTETLHFILTSPLQVPLPSEISSSYKKMMRACAPSTGGGSGFMAAVEESGWMSQLSRLLQLAGAVADLMDVQGSSVLVCLEDGWDNTAQVQHVSQLEGGGVVYH